jgi:hypothetical protein
MKKRRKKKEQGERKRENKRDRVLFGGKFLPLGKQKNWTANYPKELSWEKRALSCHISRENKLNLPYLDHRFLYVASI